MNPTQILTIRVPSTSANLGPGFDIMGLAIDQYATFEIRGIDPGQFTLLDADGADLGIPEESNLVKQAYLRTMERFGADARIPGIEARVAMDLPTGRGFGSSACALNAGVVAASSFLREADVARMTLEDELRLLLELEGHPDNVFAARLGGVVISMLKDLGENQPPEILPPVIKRLPEDLGLAIVVPEYQIFTNASRKKLPGSYPLKSVLQNLQGVALWMEYLHQGDPGLLKAAIAMDRLHQPFRGETIPGFNWMIETIERSTQRGLIGATISGSGPGILVYYSKPDQAAAIEMLEQLLSQIQQREGHRYPYRICQPDYDGVTVERHPNTNNDYRSN